MTAIPRAAEALTSASGRFERASLRLLEAASGAGGEDAGAAIAEMITAKIEFKANLAVVGFSNEMWSALLDINRDRG